MTLEQLALLGIGIFAFMALTAFFNATRSIKRITRKSSRLLRYRRPVTSDKIAQKMAENLVVEVYKSLKNDSGSQGSQKINPDELKEELEKARQYFLSRVDNRNKAIFNKVADEYPKKQ